MTTTVQPSNEGCVESGGRTVPRSKPILHLGSKPTPMVNLLENGDTLSYEYVQSALRPSYPRLRCF